MQGEEYQIRPYPPLQAELLARKQQDQLARTVQAQQVNKQRMEELERRQRIAMEGQSIAAQNNMWSFGKHETAHMVGGPRATHSASTQLPPQEPSEVNKIPLIKKPGVFNLFMQPDGSRNPREDAGMRRGDSPRTPSRPTDRERAAEDQRVPKYFGEEETADDGSVRRGSRVSPRTGRVPSPDRPDAETMQQMRLVAHQNKALQDEILRVKKLNEVKAQAHKYADEVQRLNQLEAKMYDYTKHLEGVKQLNRVGDELNKQARNQALAAIKQGIVRKEARERELLRPLLEAGNKKKQLAQDPWARQMIEMMMTAGGRLPNKLMQQYQDDSDDDQDEHNSKKSKNKPKGKKNKRDRELEKEKEKMKKENEEKLKKMNDEIERLKKESAEGVKEAPIGREEIGKLIAEAFEKNREAVEAKAKKMGIGPEDIVNLPNGVSVIKSKDPSKPPMFIMPQEPLRKALEAYSRSDSDSLKSSVLSESTQKTAPPDPMQQMMLGMLMGKNMEMMMNDGQSSTSSKSSSTKSSKSSLSRTPIIINQPPPIYYPAPEQQFPRLKSPKDLQTSQSVLQGAQSLPKIKPTTTGAKTQMRVSQSSVSSLKSSSILGDPIPPPVKLPFLYNNPTTDAMMPKPAPTFSLDRPSSLRNMDIPIQSKCMITQTTPLFGRRRRIKFRCRRCSLSYRCITRPTNSRHRLHKDPRRQRPSLQSLQNQTNHQAKHTKKQPSRFGRCTP